MSEHNVSITSDGEWVVQEAVYGDPSAAHERAMREMSNGAKSIKIVPENGKHIVSWIAKAKGEA